MSELGPFPPETFRIRPWHGSEYWFLVHVAETLPAMRRAIKMFAGEVHQQQLGGMVGTEPLNEETAATSPGIAGVVFLARTNMGCATVAHELAHAAFRVCDRLRVRVEHWVPQGYGFATQPDVQDASGEEKFCSYMGYLTADFWREAYDRKLVS